jgi:probable FeS assembly SUF system protein SufT
MASKRRSQRNEGALKEASDENNFQMAVSDSITIKRDVDSIEIPSGTRKTLHVGDRVRVMQSRGGSFTVATEVGVMYRVDDKDADALGLARSSPVSVTVDAPLTEQMVINQLKTVFDPEIPVNIVDLGLVYECAIRPLPEQGNRIDVKMAMTAPGCGMGNVLRADAETKLARLPDVKEVHVEIVFDPPWHAGRMSEAARLQLGLDLEDQPSPLPILREKR